MEGIKDLDATIVYYESPRSLARTLNDLEIVLGDRPAVVARELTKLYEEYSRGTISELRRYYEKNIPKGEIVILVGKNETKMSTSNKGLFISFEGIDGCGKVLRLNFFWIG